MAQATYAAIATLKNSSTFQDRVVIAVTKYAQYLLGQPGSSFKQVTWAKSAYANPAGVATGLFPAVAFDSNISDTTNLENSTDAEIQAATETVVNTSLNF